MIDVTLIDEEIHKLILAGSPGELAAELMFTVCFTYGQLYSQDKEAAEGFRRAVIDTLNDPIAWRQLLPKSTKEGDGEEKDDASKVIDFVSELEKRKHK